MSTLWFWFYGSLCYMLSCPIVSDVCSHVARKIHTQFTLSARLGGKVSNLELYLTWKYSFLEKSNNAKLFSTTGLFLSANLWSELRDQISKTIVMVGLCESELTAGGIHWFWFNSADCKNNNKIDKIELIIDIQAKQINKYLCYQCQVYLNLWIARYVIFYIFMAFDSF